MLTKMRGARSRQERWVLGLLGAPALLAAAFVGCSGKTEQRVGSTPDRGPTSGTSGSSGSAGTSSSSGGSNPSGASGAASDSGGAAEVEGGAPTVEAGAPASGGTGDTPPSGVGGEAGESSSLPPNQYPRPAICAEPRPTEPPLLAAPSGCAPGCREIVGFAFDTDRGCIDTANGTLVACSCGKRLYGTNDSEACLKTKDGRRWLVARGDELALEAGESAAQSPPPIDAGVWGKCVQQESEELKASPSCELVACDQRIESHCTVAGSNAGIWTMSCENEVENFPAYDAQGCLKPSCETDDSCQAEERCVRGVGWVPQCTFDSEGGCNCGSRWSAAFDPAVCVDVATAGPRGPWERYRVEDGERGTVWDLLPDGTLIITTGKLVKETKVSAIDLGYLTRELDEYEIRAGVQNGFNCPVSGGGGVPGSVTLAVAGQTYARDVSGCFYDLPLTQILRQYGQ